MILGLQGASRCDYRHTPYRMICVTRFFVHFNYSATSAALADIAALLSATLTVVNS